MIEGDPVYHRADGPGYEGEVVQIVGRRVTVAWPIPGRLRKVKVTYDKDELVCTDPHGRADRARAQSGGHFDS